MHPYDKSPNWGSMLVTGGGVLFTGGTNDRKMHAFDAAVQAHGGNGMTVEYGLADLWGMVRLLRIAPVSREMILNHVARHALGLPRSY